MNHPPDRSRVLYAGLLLVTVASGLASRQFPAHLPEFVVRFAGDALWAAMVFWGLALLFPSVRTRVLGVSAVAIAWSVEVSQLVRVPWLDAARATRFGALVLGQGFLWTDLGLYAVGVASAAAVDLTLRRSAHP